MADDFHFTNVTARNFVPKINDKIDMGTNILSDIIPWMKNSRNGIISDNTAKVYTNQIIKLVQETQIIEIGVWINKLLVSRDETIKMIMDSADNLKGRDGEPLALASKRTYLDGVIFFIELLLYNAKGKLGSDLVLNQPYQIILDKRNEMDMEVFHANSTADAPILSPDELRSLIVSKYALGTRPRCVLLLYLEVPLRDDAQLRIWQGNRDEFMAAPILENLLLINENYSRAEPPSDVFTIWISQSKTIGTRGDGSVKNHMPFSVDLSPDLTYAIWYYLKQHSVGWSPGLNTCYIFGSQKLSQTIIFWTKELGLYLERKRGKGVEKCGAGVSYFRRLHTIIAAEKGPKALAETAKRAGHTKETQQTKYTGKKRSLDELNIDISIP